MASKAGPLPPAHFGVTDEVAAALRARILELQTASTTRAKAAIDAVQTFDGSVVIENPGGGRVVVLPAANGASEVQVALFGTDRAAVKRTDGTVAQLDLDRDVFCLRGVGADGESILQSDGTLIHRLPSGTEWALKPGGRSLIRIDRQQGSVRAKLGAAQARDAALSPACSTARESTYDILHAWVCRCRADLEARVAACTPLMDAAAAADKRARAALASEPEEETTQPGGSLRVCRYAGGVLAQHDGTSVVVQLDSRHRVQLAQGKGSMDSLVVDSQSMAEKKKGNDDDAGAGNKGSGALVVLEASKQRRVLQSKQSGIRVVLCDNGDRIVVYPEVPEEGGTGRPGSQSDLACPVTQAAPIQVKLDAAGVVVAVAESGGVQTQLQSTTGGKTSAIARVKPGGDVTQYSSDGVAISSSMAATSGQAAEEEDNKEEDDDKAEVLDARKRLARVQAARTEAQTAVSAARAAAERVKAGSPRVMPQKDGSHIVVFTDGTAVRVDASSENCVIRERSSDRQVHVGLSDGTFAETCVDGAQTVLLKDKTLVSTSSSGLRWVHVQSSGRLAILQVPGSSTAAAAAAAAVVAAPAAESRAEQGEAISSSVSSAVGEGASNKRADGGGESSQVLPPVNVGAASGEKSSVGASAPSTIASASTSSTPAANPQRRQNDKTDVAAMVAGVRCVADGTVGAGDLVTFETKAGNADFRLKPCDKAAFLAERLALRDAPEIIQAIDAFYVAFGPRRQQTDDVDWDGVMTRDEYVYMHVRIQKALQPDFDAAAAVALAAEEYKQDLDKGLGLAPRLPWHLMKGGAGAGAAAAGVSSTAAADWFNPGASVAKQRTSAHGQGGGASDGGLSYTGVHAAVFEVVDVWTEEVQVDVYARFLTLLLQRITDPTTGRPVADIDRIKATPALGASRTTLFAPSAAPLSSETKAAKKKDGVPPPPTQDVVPTWDKKWIGGVKKTKGKNNYTFSKDGHTATKSAKVGAGIISVIRAREAFAPGGIFRVRMRIGGAFAGAWPGDLDIGITTARKTNRRSRLADDGCTTEFCIATPRALLEAHRARCHVESSLRVGDEVTLVVDLSGSAAAADAEGRLEIRIRKPNDGSESESTAKKGEDGAEAEADDEATKTYGPVVFAVGIPTQAAKKRKKGSGQGNSYVLVAAMRQSNLCLEFV